jgi:hypothetical protein
MLLQQLNDLSQMFDAMAPMCSRSHTCFTAPTETSLNAEAKTMNGCCLCWSILPCGSFVFICTLCPHSKYITFKLKEIINIGSSLNYVNTCPRVLKVLFQILTTKCII